MTDLLDGQHTCCGCQASGVEQTRPAEHEVTHQRVGDSAPRAGLLYVCSLPSNPDAALNGLERGPLPVDYIDTSGVHHEAAWGFRNMRMDPSVQPLLYDDGVRFHRWTSSGSTSLSENLGAGVTLLGAEVLIPGYLRTSERPAEGNGGRCLVLVHLLLPDGEEPARTLDRIREIAQGHLTRGEDRLRKHQDLVDAALAVPQGGVTFPVVETERVATYTWCRIAADAAALEVDAPGKPELVGPAQQWARAFATLNEPGRVDFTKDSQDRRLGDLQLAPTLIASALRDGVGLVSQVDGGDAAAAAAARAAGVAQSFYADVLLLAAVQRLGLSDLDAELSRVSRQNIGELDRIINLEVRLIRFRNEVWWEQASSARPANSVLNALQRQHRLGERLAELRADVQDTARVAENRQQRLTNQLLLILTVATAVIGLPSAVVLSVAALVSGPDVTLAVASVALFMALAAVTGVLLMLWHRRQRGPDLLSGHRLQ